MTKTKVCVLKNIFYRNNWGIATCAIVNNNYKEEGKYITIKGNMPYLIEGEYYNTVLKQVNDPKYGVQFEIQRIALDVEVTSNSGQKTFLQKLFTEQQVKSMYDSFDNPFDLLLNKDIEKLVTIKGCGFVTAQRWIERFESNYGLCRVFIELEGYNLTFNMIEKLLRHYKSPDIVISKVKENPYSLCEISGISWKTVDKIAMDGGITEHDYKRVKGYILYFLQEKGNNGVSWVDSTMLMNNILDNLGEDIPDSSISQALSSLKEDNLLWHNENKTRFGLMYYYKLEEEIAEHFLRILNAENNFIFNNWEEKIKQQEIEQGWEYTSQQLNGIETALKNNVTVIHGLAGCGKTTIVKAILKILDDKYSYAMCALAGRAGVRLSEVAGGHGSTIHSLLNPAIDEQAKNDKRNFYFYEDRPLPYDIIIVDEISMIGGVLFRDLLRAIKTGAKLILLGDIGQLESIGECKVAVDIITAPEIPTVYLDKIHRQAQKSAIITESVKMRHGEAIIDDEYAGIETRGELQDLTLDIYSDKSNSFYNAMHHVSELLSKGVNILDMQVMCPVKEKGDACTLVLNKAIQELYNPQEKTKKEIVHPTGKFVLRTGDKIINTRNNKKIFDDQEKERQIFNGNVGIIHDIIDSTILAVDFLDIGRVFIPSEHIKYIELGYAITVHKMQGDQKDYIIGVIDFISYNMLSRELLYTMVTRAIKHCTLVAQNSALLYAINTQSIQTKRSFLQDILYKKTNESFTF